MSVATFLHKLKSSPNSIEFAETINVIDANYEFQPSAFINGTLVNEAGQNNGSCKIFAFAQLNELRESDTLALFGHYYRDDVLKNPNGSDHQNIRNFMQTGWPGVQFSGQALLRRVP